MVLKVGKEFILEDENTFDGINLIETGTKVEVNGEEFSLYKGETFEARKLIIEDLEKIGQLDSVKEHEHAVGHCERCKRDALWADR